MSIKTVRNLSLGSDVFRAGANLIEAVVLVAAFALLLGLALWTQYGAGVAVGGAALAVALILLIALRLPPGAQMRLYGARPHDPASLKQVDAILAELSRRASLPARPQLYVLPSNMLSAFSAGSARQSAIAVTEGMLRQLTMREIAAVLAHEIAHIRRGDLTVFAVSDVVTRFAQALYYAGLALVVINALRFIAGDEPVSWSMVLLLVLAPAIINLVQLALPRRRDLAADIEGARACGDPLGLASAVTRMDTSRGSAIDDILPPVPARKVPLPSLLRAPPPDADRIARLRALDVPPMTPLDVEEGPRISMIGFGPIAMRPRYRWPGVWL
jgi:heat shock protein HtpX